ncbi:MAG TPA: phosphatidate cytidylyltransferase [Rudaea sp.]
MAISGGKSILRQRVVTALLITPLAIAMILLLPTIVFAAIIGVLCLIAAWEWSRLSGMRSRPLRAVLIGGVGLAMVALWIFRGTWAWWLLIAAGAAWWFVAIAWLRSYSFAAAPTRENTAIKLFAGGLTVLPAWCAMMTIHESQPSPHTWALYSLLLIWVADTFAFLAGKRWGRNKLAPKISPGKTIEGVYGALAGSALIAVIGGWLLHVRDGKLVGLVVLAMLSVALSIVGDLFESLIKRHANVKDSGALFPGHGGVFDRLDSVFAALPVFALGKYLLGL